MTSEKKEELKKRILEIQKELAELSEDDLNQVVGGVQENVQEGDPGIFFVQVVTQVAPAAIPVVAPVQAPTVMPNVVQVVAPDVNVAINTAVVLMNN